jgi:hypothetical protein
MTIAVAHDWLADMQSEKAWRPADYPPLATLRQQSATSVGQAAQQPPCEETTSDDPFIQALRDDSNREMDWLWLATRLSSSLQRRYALERALQINPRSGAAKRGLKQLRRRTNRPLDLN